MNEGIKELKELIKEAEVETPNQIGKDTSCIEDTTFTEYAVIEPENDNISITSEEIDYLIRYCSNKGLKEVSNYLNDIKSTLKSKLGRVSA